MAKLKITDFKKFVAQMSPEEMRDELLKLFGKIEQVQNYYAQELMSPEDRKSVLDEYKKKIYNQFWTRGGNPRVASNTEIRKIISALEKISVMPSEVVELLLYRVEIALDHADEFGGGPEANFSSAMNAYEKALKIIATEHLEKYFEDQCLDISSGRGNLGYGIDSTMEELNKVYLGLD